MSYPRMSPPSMEMMPIEDRTVTVDRRKKTIYLIGDINEQSAAQFLPAVRSLDAGGPNPLTIVLTSAGGDVDAGFAMFDALKAVNCSVRVEGFGNVYSMALLILQAANERWLAPSCSLLIHDGMIGSGATPFHAALPIAKNDAVRSDLYFKLISDRTGLAPRRLKAMARRETFMDARRAVLLGFADLVLGDVS